MDSMGRSRPFILRLTTFSLGPTAAAAHTIGRKEVTPMDLRGNQITVGELLANPRARQVLQQHFPQAFRLPVLTKSGTMTLATAIKLGAAYVPRKAIQEALEELRAL